MSTGSATAGGDAAASNKTTRMRIAWRNVIERAVFMFPTPLCRLADETARASARY
jgi:hypothetical protein